MAAFAYDVRYALKHLRGAPGLTSVILLVLALGLGGVAALFSLLNALVLRPAGVPDPGRLVAVSLTTATGAAAQIPVPAINMLAAGQDVFGHVASYNRGGLDFVTIDGAGQPRPIQVIGPTYYDTLGIRPYLGRLISSDDWTQGAAAPVAVVSYAFWQRQFGGRAEAVGKAIEVSGRPKTIIGVTPADFSDLLIDVQPDLSVPFGYDRDVPPSATNPSRASHLIARLKPGVTLEQARALVVARWPAVREATIAPNQSVDNRARIQSQQIHIESAAHGFSTLRTQYGQPLTLVLFLAGVLLVIACVNLAGLLGARAAARHREVAVRLALGAGRARLARQFVLESLVLSIAGAGAAVPVAYWASTGLGTMLWTGATPFTVHLTPDWRVLALMAAAAAAIGVAIGMMPAWTATRGDLTLARRSSGAAPRSGGVLLVIQVALSFVLVFGGALLARSLWLLRSVDLGFQPDAVAFARVVPRPPDGYRGLDIATYYPELQRQLSALPGVQSVALSSIFPAPIAQPQSIALAGAAGDQTLSASMDVVSPGFFATLGIPVMVGRDFSWDDRTPNANVAVISQRLARLLTPGNAVGQHVRIGAESGRQDVEVVGVVGDVRLSDFRAPAPLAVYRPWLQEPQAARTPIISLRAATPAGLTDGVFRVLSSLGREYAVAVLPLREHVNRTFLRERVMALLSAIFAGLAAILTLVGVYGVSAFRVAGRTREIGVRLALGASRPSVAWRVTRESLRLALIALALGIPCALWAARYAKSLLYDLSPWDPGLFALAMAFIVIVAMAGTLLPARRAAATDPMTALRCD